MRLIAVGAAGVLGAALIYFLDPARGRERRRQALHLLGSTILALVEERPAPERAREPETPRREARPPVADTWEPEPEREPEPVAARRSESDPSVLYLEGDPAPPMRIVTLDDAASGRRASPRLAPDAALPPLPPRRRRLLSFRLLAGLSTVAALSAVALAAWAVVLERDADRTTAAVPPPRADEDQARAIALLAEPETSRIPVAGSRGTLVLVVGVDGESVLILRNVRRAPAGKAYEAWVIDGEQPTPAGLFSGAETVVPLTKPVPKGAVVAVTLERAGGVPAPTTQPIFATKRA